MTLKTVAILGSVREGRQGIKAAKFITNVFKERGHEVFLIDPKEYDLPLLTKTFKQYGNDAPENMKKISKIFKEADAFILVTAEYNHGIPPALKNLLDHFMEEYFWRPSAIVSYSVGGFGGARAAVQLREVVAELKMPSIPSVFSISKIHEVLDDEGNPTPGGEKLKEGVEKFVGELEWYSSAMKEARVKGTPY